MQFRFCALPFSLHPKSSDALQTSSSFQFALRISLPRVHQKNGALFSIESGIAPNISTLSSTTVHLHNPCQKHEERFFPISSLHASRGFLPLPLSLLPLVLFCSKNPSLPVMVFPPSLQQHKLSTRIPGRPVVCRQAD